MQIEDQLQAMGFTLVRRRKHRIFRHENGAPLVVPVSASDHRAQENLLSVARKIAGVQKQRTTGPQRPRKGRVSRDRIVRDYALLLGITLTQGQAKALLSRHGSVREVKRWLDRLILIHKD